MSTTSVLVQVMAVGGKFVGDDIGGAAITIHDADSNETLAQGVTKGDSGPNNAGGVMCASVSRGQPIPFVAGTTSSFSADISLTSPRRLRISAYGPLGARGSANTASTTTWLTPGNPITKGNGILLELPGLICQIINPPTHTTTFVEGAHFQIVTNIAMMCGCPISVKKPDAICPGNIQPWLPEDFNVTANIVIHNNGGSSVTFPLAWDTSAQGNVPGRFVASLSNVLAGTYQMTIIAQQKSTGNTGVDMGTFVVQKASS